MKRCERRRGSALLLTLAVLSLLLIIAIFFAFDVQLSSRLSDNYRHSIQAKLLNECGLSRAIAFIDDLDRFKDFEGLRNQNAFLYPAQSSFADMSSLSDWQAFRIFPLIEVLNPNQEGLELAYTTSFLTSSGAAAWELTPDTLSGGLLDSATWDSVVVGDQVIGQFTYLIIDETGKLDPGYLSDSRVLFRTRLQDLAISDFDSSLTDSLVVDSCFSYAHLAMSGTPDNDSQLVRKLLFPGTLPVKEQFWFDINGDSTCSVNEVFDRMDITSLGTDATVAKKLYGFLLSGYQTTNPPPTAGQSTSLWLQGHGATIDSATARRYAAQLTANIMDYIDSDSTPSMLYVGDASQNYRLEIAAPTDYPLTSMPPNVDSVIYGIEKGMGLAALSFDIFLTADPSKTSKVMAGILKCQLFNPFGTPIDSVKIDAVMQIEGTGGNGVDTIPNINWVWEQTCNDSYFVSKSDYNVLGYDTSFTLIETDSSFSLDTVTIKSLKIYSDSGNGYELTMSYPRFISSKLLSDVATWHPRKKLSTITNNVWHGFAEAVIPTTGLTYPDFDILAISESPIEDIGSLSGDSEVGRYWQISQHIDGYTNANTAVSSLSRSLIEQKLSYSKNFYGMSDVRNAPLTSLGDLGRIHSPYTPNQSIKFWHHGPASTHDAYLLDMFTTDIRPKHKVNINTTHTQVIKGLVTGLIVEGDPLKDEFADNWLAHNGTNGGHPFLYRGELYQFFLNYDPRDVDIDAENAIGNFIELLDTRQNYFTVISCARSVEDIGSSTVDHPKKVQLGPSRYGIVKGNYKSISAVYRDAWGVEKPRILRTTVLEE